MRSICCPPNEDPVNVWKLIAVDMMGGPRVAPVFMVCLGIGICYTRHNDPKSLASRGLRLLLTAYLLNILRGFIPDLVYALFTGNFSDVDLIFDALMSTSFISPGWRFCSWRLSGNCLCRLSD